MASNVIDSAYPNVLRGTFQQTLEGLLYTAPTYRYGSRGEGGVTTYEDVPMSGLVIRRFELMNRAATASDVAVGFRWANKHWLAGQWTEATNTFTNDTADAQDTPGTTPDFALQTTTVNDGFIILSQRKFAWVSIRVITASIDAVSTATEVRYSNFAGTGWTTVAAGQVIEDQLTSAAVLAAGELRFVWVPPIDWGKVTNITGVPDGYYALQMRSTDAPTTAAVASVIEIGTLGPYVEELASNGIYENENAQYADPYADAVMAYFSDVNVGNRVYAEVTGM